MNSKAEKLNERLRRSQKGEGEEFEELDYDEQKLEEGKKRI
jgi:hypothetical protein